MNTFTNAQLQSYAECVYNEIESKLLELNLNFSFIPMQNRNFQEQYAIESRLTDNLELWDTIRNNSNYFENKD